MEWTRQRAVLSATTLFVVLWSILVARGLWKAGVFQEDKSNDIHAYHAAARSVWDWNVASSYESPHRSNLYPPTFAILLAPLGLLPYRLFATLWVFLSAAIVLYIFRHMGRILGIPLSLPARIAGFLLAYRLIESDFANGNANLFVLAVVMASFDLLWTRGSFLAGGLFAIAILSKVSPVIGLAWVVFRLRWRFLAGVVVGGVLFGGLLPVAVLGREGAEKAWSAWQKVTLEHVHPSSGSYSKEEASGYEPGQSIRAFFHRILRDSDATAHDGKKVSIHLFALTKGSADVVYLLAAGGILILALLLGWRRAPGLGIAFRPEEIATICALMVALAPLSRKAHFLALWPAAVLGFDAFRSCDSHRRARVGAALWSFAFVSVVATSPDLIGRDLSTRLLAYCPMSWAALALSALLCAPGFFPQGGRKLNDPGKAASCVGAVPQRSC